MFIKLEDANGQINYINIEDVSHIRIVKDNVHGMGTKYSQITMSFINSINNCCVVIKSDDLKEYIDKIEMVISVHNANEIYFEVKQ